MFTILMASSIFVSVIAIAQAQELQPTYGYLDVNPKTVQVGGRVTIAAFVAPRPSGFFDIYVGMVFTVTRPDGTIYTETHDSLTDGSWGFTFVPSQVGTYTAKMTWAGDDTHQPSESQLVEFTAQEEAIPEYPKVPLPDYKWDWPITQEYLEWYQISGAWPSEEYDQTGSSSWGGSNANPYSKGPNSPHVLWKRQMVQVGGLIGGAEGYLGVCRGDQGTTFQPNHMVAGYGRMWWTTTKNVFDENGTLSDTIYDLHCISLYTGEDIYTMELPVAPGAGPSTTSKPQLSLQIDAVPPPGGNMDSRVKLWVIGSGIWQIEPWQGKLVYYNPTANGRFNTRDNCLYVTSGGNTTKYDGLDYLNLDSPSAQNAIIWEKPIPSITMMNEKYLVRYGGASPYGMYISVWDAETGDVIVDRAEFPYVSSDIRGIGDDMFFIHCIDRVVRGISLETGKLVWESEPQGEPWGAFASYTFAYAYGNFYVGSYDGHAWCYDAQTGDTVFSTYFGDAQDQPFSHLGAWGPMFVADNKVYWASGEHSPPNPQPRGDKLFCMDAHTGEILWTLDGLKGTRMHYGGIAEGVLWYWNQYDSCIWAFGRGESEITVQAPETVVPEGDAVLIQGTIYDKTAPKDNTPCVAPESQNEWMQYLFNNAPMPMGGTGVAISLQACMEDGSVEEIAVVRSDSMGNFAQSWTPPGKGLYKIIATFLGDESYYASSAETALSVGSASVSADEITDEAAHKTIAMLPDTSVYFIGIIIAVVIAIIIGLLGLMRKK